MSSLEWRSEGISRAVRAGGVELEVYRQPGFCRGKGVRVPNEVSIGAGVFLAEREWPSGWTWPPENPVGRDPEPDGHRRDKA